MFKEPFKSSPISILDNTLKMTWLATVLIITNFAIIVNKINEFNKDINANLVLIVLLFVFIISMAIFFFIDWNITRISYNNGVITVYKNLVLKDKYEFCVDKISSIVIEQNIFEKLFRVSRVKIYTNAINKYKEDMQFIIKKEKAIMFRDVIFEELFHNNNKDIINKEDYDIKFKLIHIIWHSFCNISVSYMVIIVNVILLIFSMINDGSIVKEVVQNLLGFLITIFAIILPVLYSLVSSVLKFYGLKFKKNDDTLVVKFRIIYY